MSRIFDAHTHTYPELLSVRATDNLGKFYNFVCQRAGTVDDLMASSRDAGVEGFLILGVATNARQVRHVNEAVAPSATRLSIRTRKTSRKNSTLQYPPD